MALLMSPDGSETVDVPDAEVQHYLSLGATYPGPPTPASEALQANPWNNPIEAGIGLFGGSAPFRALGRAAPIGAAVGRALGPVAEATGIPALGRAAGSAATRMASGAGKSVGGVLGKFAARKMPGADLVELASNLRTALQGAAPVAPAVAEAVPAAIPAAAEVGTVASRTASSALTREEIKDATRYWQTRTHAMMTEAGAPAEAVAQRKWISGVVGREIKSRTELTIPEWKQVHDAAGQLLSEKAAVEAAKKASVKAATAAERAITKAPRPKVGTAASRIKAVPKPKILVPQRTATGPAFEVPGQLQSQLQQSVQIQAEMDRRGLDPATQAQVWQALRTGTGGQP